VLTAHQPAPCTHRLASPRPPFNNAWAACNRGHTPYPKLSTYRPLFSYVHLLPAAQAEEGDRTFFNRKLPCLLGVGMLVQEPQIVLGPSPEITQADQRQVVDESGYITATSNTATGSSDLGHPPSNVSIQSPALSAVDGASVHSVIQYHFAIYTPHSPPENSPEDNENSSEDNENSSGADQHGSPPSEPSELQLQPTMSSLFHFFVNEFNILKYLSLEQILEVRGVSPQMSRMAQFWVLHKLIPESQIEVSTMSSVQGHQSTEQVRLSPVIKRVVVAQRVLPGGRLVFEPQYEEVEARYQPNHFMPVKIIFTTPDQQTSYHWSLEPLQEASRHEQPYRHRSYLYTPECYSRNKFLIFHKFKIEESKEEIPIKVFYKRQNDGHPDTKLHAVSIPLECLLELVFAKRGLQGSNVNETN
jgi:hypothetical protein